MMQLMASSQGFIFAQFVRSQEYDLFAVMTENHVQDLLHAYQCQSTDFEI